MKFGYLGGHPFVMFGCMPCAERGRKADAGSAADVVAGLTGRMPFVGALALHPTLDRRYNCLAPI